MPLNWTFLKAKQRTICCIPIVFVYTIPAFELRSHLFIISLKFELERFDFIGHA